MVKLPLVANAKPERLVSTRFDDYAGVWSPDRRWLAYQSDESGRGEVYVRDMSSAGGRWQVSTTGGDEPSWSPDGRELYYRNETQMMAVSVDTRTTFAPKRRGCCSMACTTFARIRASAMPSTPRAIGS